MKRNVAYISILVLTIFVGSLIGCAPFGNVVEESVAPAVDVRKQVDLNHTLLGRYVPVVLEGNNGERAQRAYVELAGGQLMELDGVSPIAPQSLIEVVLHQSVDGASGATLLQVMQTPQMAQAISAAPQRRRLLIVPMDTHTLSLVRPQVELASLFLDPEADFARALRRETDGVFDFEISMTRRLLADIKDDKLCSWLKIVNVGKRVMTQAGYNRDDYEHVVFLVPQMPETMGSCDWSGGASIGDKFAFDGTSVVTDLPNRYPTRTALHELGHNFGFAHASGFRCPDPDSDNELVGYPFEDHRIELERLTCAPNEYGGTFSAMGNGFLQHGYGATLKKRLGWLDASAQHEYSRADYTNRRTKTFWLRDLSRPIADSDLTNTPELQGAANILKLYIPNRYGIDALYLEISEGHLVYRVIKEWEPTWVWNLNEDNIDEAMAGWHTELVDYHWLVPESIYLPDYERLSISDPVRNAEDSLNIAVKVTVHPSVGAHCSNGLQDGDEAGVDCGGSCRVRCPQPPDEIFE